MNVESRRSVLSGCGATEAEIEELLVYTENVFQHPVSPLTLPLEDEPFVPAFRPEP